MSLQINEFFEVLWNETDKIQIKTDTRSRIKYIEHICDYFYRNNKDLFFTNPALRNVFPRDLTYYFSFKYLKSQSNCNEIGSYIGGVGGMVVILANKKIIKLLSENKQVSEMLVEMEKMIDFNEII